MYEYVGTIIKVVDGDTVDVNVDLGMDVHCNQRFRLLGINAPEHGNPAGDASTAWLKTLLLVGDTVIIRTHKDKREKYGRYLATIEAAPHDWAGTLPVDIATESIKAGHALPWDDKGSRPV